MRFQPRTTGAQRLLKFDMQITPTPAGQTCTLDPEGNVVMNVWFDGTHDRVTIVTTSDTETLRGNPFDFLLTNKNRHLPVRYSTSEKAVLAPSLAWSNHDGVLKLAENVLGSAKGDTRAFLDGLNELIYTKFDIIYREEGDAWTADETLARGAGACRDVAVLFAEACRAVGMAARFVSGYQEGDKKQDRRDLHAWAEVYLPGAGWRGYDPTHGLVVADRHIAVAASAEPSHAGPVSGTFRGTGVESHITADIELSVSEKA